ncbi:ubiquinol-cytochrome-c reductase cytochrome c1 [Colletotrichum somersetense]|nr:ubiquinol-cytochrome-c reductase cytochrome c1 [Colletotrichum somersetense]
MSSAAAPSRQSRPTSLLSMLAHPQTNSACLPYKAQHTLLVRTQGILENACFKYAVHNMPQVLQSRQWDVSECGELHVWVRILKNETEARLKDEAIPQPHPSWNSFFRSIINLRHSAVHREQLTSSDLESYFRDAHNFTRMLRDEEGAETLARFREETGECLETFEFGKKNISRSFQERMDEINVRRAELDTLERQARQDFLQEDWTIHAKLGSDLKEAVVNAEVAQAKEEEKDTNDHKERKASAVGLFACLRYLFMLCRRYHR